MYIVMYFVDNTNKSIFCHSLMTDFRAKNAIRAIEIVFGLLLDIVFISVEFLTYQNQVFVNWAPSPDPTRML